MTKIINLSFRFLMGSSYSWKQLQSTAKECINLIFGTDLDFKKDERKANQKNQTDIEGRVVEGIYVRKPLKAYTDRVGLLLRGLQLTIYGISWGFSALFGNFIAWWQTGKNINATISWVLGDASKLFKKTSEDVELQEKTQPEWIYFGILPFAVSCLAGILSCMLNLIDFNAMNYYWIRQHLAEQPEKLGYEEALKNLIKGEDEQGSGLMIRKFFNYVNLFKIILYLGFAAYGIIACSIQSLWKLTLGNIIPNERGYDGYFNRIYYRFKTGDASAVLNTPEQIQQKFFELLRVLPPAGEIPGLMSENEIFEVSHSLIAKAKQIGLGRWILNGFLYDMRKAYHFGGNTLTEKVIIEFAKVFQEYTKKQKAKSYQTINSSFFKKCKKLTRSKILRRENPIHYQAEEEAIIIDQDIENRDPNYQKIEKLMSFIEVMLTSPAEQISVEVGNKERILPKIIGF